MKQDRYAKLAHGGRPIEGLVVDIHMHLGEEPNFPVPFYRDLDLVVHEMDRHGVDVGAVSCIPAVLGGLQPGGNELVLEAVRRFPDRFFGWIGINPFYPDAMLAELERCHEAGCRGLKIHDSVGLPYEHKNYRVAFEFAAARGLPILAHTWGGQLDKMEPFFREFAVNWSLAHAGSDSPEKYVRVAREHDNVYLDVCYSRCPRGLIEHFVREGVAEKVMFSSDCYFMGMSQQLGRIVFADVSPEHKALILGGNARRFLGALCPRGGGKRRPTTRKGRRST